MDVADDTKISNREDRSILVLVDGNDVLRTLHAHHVLRRTRDATGQVDVWLHGLAGLAHLVGIGHPSSVNNRTTRASGTVEQFGQIFDEGIVLDPQKRQRPLRQVSVRFALQRDAR